MKFLIAASFLCIALVGQAQGGSLRGLSVITPHEQYGVPLLSPPIQTEEIKPEIAIPIELPKQDQPITSKPFIDHLPLIDSAVNFGYPSGKPSASLNEPVTQKPEILLLQPGLPSLPNAPIVPVNAERPIVVTQQLSNSVLPPKPELPLIQPGIPILQAAPVIVPIVPIGLNYQGFVSFPPPINVGPIQPAASLVPLPISQPIQIAQQPSNEYLPPQPQLPLLQPGLPSLPEAPKVPLIVEQPIQAHAELSNSYLPPQPQLPLLQPGLPSLPEAPKVQEQPIQPPQPELPLLQPGLPALPEAPKVPLTIATEQPIQAHADLSNTYLPPKPELPLLQPGLPSLPEAPKVPLIVEQPIQAHAELSNDYSPPKPELPLLQPGLPSLPEAPKVPLNIAIEQPAQAATQPQLPLLQPTEAPIIPFDIEKPFSIILVEKKNPSLSPFLLPVSGILPKPESNVGIELPKVTEIPALPEAPVVPASPQIVDESNNGYSYNTPSSAFVEAAQLPSASQAPIVNQLLSQIQSVPGAISSQILGISQASYIQPAQLIPIQSSLTAQQNFPQAAPHHGYDYSAPTQKFQIPY